MNTGSPRKHDQNILYNEYTVSKKTQQKCAVQCIQGLTENTTKISCTLFVWYLRIKIILGFVLKQKTNKKLAEIVL